MSCASTRGIHPAILAERGLAAALTVLARRSPVLVQLDVRTAARLPGPIEAAAYFVVSEALANAVKHANATVVRVAVGLADGVARVSVSDDGVGGADPVRGSGLAGLKERPRFSRPLGATFGAAGAAMRSGFRSAAAAIAPCRAAAAS